MDIIELLKLRGLDTSAKIKLVRHQDKRYDVNEIYEKGHFEIYQNYQEKPNFECEYIVSFLGWEYSQAKFINVYRVGQRKPAKEVPLPPDFPYPEWNIKGVHYELEVVKGFEDLKERVIIDWGGAALSWHQWLTKKEVVQILPKGYVKNFSNYSNIIISYQELVKIIHNPDANRDWQISLSAVAGVYLILDIKTGHQYIGSAYGETGIYGRWSVYASKPDGGNAKLKELLKDNPGYENNFKYTILETLPISMNKDEVIKHEELYKKKLGTKAFGLN